MSDVNVPKIGPVNKKVLIPIVAAGAAFVGWKFYQSRTGVDDTADATDPGLTDDGTIPSLTGPAFADTTDTGDTSTATATSTDTYGFSGTTNDQWTQYATVQLQQSDTWSYTDIVTALGNFINNRPLSTLQQSIVQAAVAVAGYPPVGSHTIIPGGNSALTVAPTGLKASSIGSTTAVVSFTGVSGATSYAASGATGTAGSSPMTVTGLKPNATNSVTIHGVTSGGAAGPASAAVSIKTSAGTLAAPKKPTVSAIGRTSMHIAVPAVSGATHYGFRVNGSYHVGTAPSFTWTKMHPNTSFSITVTAINAAGATSPPSPITTAKTKK
jgi:hypothetical protein